MTTPTTPTHHDHGTDPYAPSPRALRIIAGCGFLLLAACCLATVVAVLVDAVDGDGAAKGFATAAFWTLLAGAVTGVAALIAPRRGLVTAQYLLAVAAPLLALLD
ncbi:hypothetical protein ACIOMM_21530 [Streptomyces sp. NPDC087908]|uniref:hypothetical protein n=1 Tax=unclassified Streptomyces TaxID=2593676 RepID=UPI00311E8F6C